MAIGARAEEAGIIRRVLLPRCLEVGNDLTLRLLARHNKISPEAVLGRNAREQIVNGGRADLGEHLPAFFVGFGEVAHRSCPFTVRSSQFLASAPSKNCEPGTANYFVSSAINASYAAASSSVLSSAGLDSSTLMI